MTTAPPLTNNPLNTALMIGNGFGILKRIAFALQRRGHTIIWAESGRDGLRIVESEEPHLIVCETDLPDLSGIEVCRQVKSSTFWETPVVVVGKLRDEYRDVPLALAAGADEYVGTFADWQLVMAKLDWLIRRRATDKHLQRYSNAGPAWQVVVSLN